MKAARPAPWSALALCFLTAVLCTGCDRHQTSAQPSATPAAAAAPPLFEGVIKAKEQRDLMLNSAEITYTISKGRIRRETKPTAPLGKLLDLGKAAAGVICDVPLGQVVLYRTGLEGKFFVRLTLADYRQLVADSVGTETDARMDMLPDKPEFWKHVGTFFAYLPKPIPPGQVQNLPEARTLGGWVCDVLAIQRGDTTYEVCHSNAVRFDRPLLELIELGLPAAVTGFPCQMRRLQAVAAPPVAPAESRALQLLKKGVDLAARVAEKAMKYEVELLSITEGGLSDSAFVLDGSFTELSSWAELERRFNPPEKHHHHHHGDWD